MTRFWIYDWETIPELFRRVLNNLIGRVHGPLAFRFVLQPLVAFILAIRAGFKDARAGRPPFGYALLFHRISRREMLLESSKDLGRLFVAAIFIDIIYEIVMLHRIYPVESLIVASILALAPYVVFRGPISRIAECWYRKRQRRIPIVPPQDR